MGEGEFIRILCTGGRSERGRSCSANEVTLHLNMADATSSHAGSPLGRLTHCIKPASHPVIGLALKPASATPTGGPRAPLYNPHVGDTPKPS